MIRKLLLFAFIFAAFSVSAHAQDVPAKLEPVPDAINKATSFTSKKYTTGKRFIVKVKKGDTIGAGLKEQKVGKQTAFAVLYKDGGKELMEEPTGENKLTWTGKAKITGTYYFNVYNKPGSTYVFTVQVIPDQKGK